MGRWREKQSQTGLFSETNHKQIIRKNNVKRTVHREAVIVMPGHTTAVKGVVFQDQFVR